MTNTACPILVFNSYGLTTPKTEHGLERGEWTLTLTLLQGISICSQYLFRSINGIRDTQRPNVSNYVRSAVWNGFPYDLEVCLANSKLPYKLIVFICSDVSVVLWLYNEVAFSSHRNLLATLSPGGRGYPWEFLVGVCRPVLQILTVFQTRKCNFPHPFSDHTS